MKLNIFLCAIVALVFLGVPGNSLADDRAVMKIDGMPVTVDEFMYLYGKNQHSASEKTSPAEYARMFALFKMKVREAEVEGLDTTREFRAEMASCLQGVDLNDEMLVREYREGLLYFEISNLRIWSEQSNNPETLNSHFLSNRDKFVWDAPRAKGWIISAVDSITAFEAKEFLESTPDSLPEDLRPLLRARFGMRAKAEKYLVKEGTNPVIDMLVFHHDSDFVTGNDWAFTWAHDCRVIEAPEEWRDVRGEVTADYQEMLATSWEKSLWESHDVEFDFDIIDEITAG